MTISYVLGRLFSGYRVQCSAVDDHRAAAGLEIYDLILTASNIIYGLL